MALSAIESIGDKKALYCPMIDARRQEVFTGVYSYKLDEVSPPASMILNENSFNTLLQESPVYFFGSGSEKFKLLAKNIAEIFFIDEPNITSQALCNFSFTKFQNRNFENPSQAHPLYIKNFYLAKN
jgi:tRNA threonylcarbamoyladenosine biosynthesis protein TsaB